MLLVWLCGAGIVGIHCKDDSIPFAHWLESALILGVVKMLWLLFERHFMTGILISLIGIL